MTRREHLALLATSVAAWPALARAQRHAPPVVGYLCPESPEPFASRIRAFRDGLASVGFAEGRNLALEFRWAEGRYDRLPVLAEELVRARVNVLVAPGGAPVALAAKAATQSIPVAFEMGGDPVALGVVASLSRPEGNLTGVSSLSVEVSPKRLEMLHDAVADAKAFGVAFNPTSPTAPAQLRNLRATAEARGVALHVMEAGDQAGFDAMFAEVRQRGLGGLVFTSDPYFANRSALLARLAGQHEVPAITQSRDFPLAGGLLSYGGNFVRSHRQCGVLAARLLKGELASDLPVQRVTALEALVNLQAAMRLRLSLPSALVATADEVVE